MKHHKYLIHPTHAFMSHIHCHSARMHACMHGYMIYNHAGKLIWAAWIFLRRKTTFPSAFLQRHANKALDSAQKCNKGTGRLYTYDRDIACLPKRFAKKEDALIPIPRKREIRQFLAVNKLVGKIQLKSNMDEKEMFREIRSVFRGPMDEDSSFPFSILQPSGGGSRTLMVPELSHSYRWTASSLAGGNAKTPIYILAEDALKVWYMHDGPVMCRHISVLLAAGENEWCMVLYNDWFLSCIYIVWQRGEWYTAIAAFVGSEGLF